MTMQLIVPGQKGDGLRCEACLETTQQGINAYDFVTPSFSHIKLLCYQCAAVHAEMWCKAGGELADPLAYDFGIPRKGGLGLWRLPAGIVQPARPGVVS